MIIRQCGPDTYVVGRFCASVYPIAFLAGRLRWRAPDAELGLHQAYPPGIPWEQAIEYLRLGCSHPSHVADGSLVPTPAVPRITYDW